MQVCKLNLNFNPMIISPSWLDPTLNNPLADNQNCTQQTSHSTQTVKSSIAIY